MPPRPHPKGTRHDYHARSPAGTRPAHRYPAVTGQADSTGRPTAGRVLADGAGAGHHHARHYTANPAVRHLPGPLASLRGHGDGDLRRLRRGGARNLAAGRAVLGPGRAQARSEEHTSELQSQSNLVCRLLLEKKKTKYIVAHRQTNLKNVPRTA